MKLKDKVAIIIGLNDVGIAVSKSLLDEGVILIAADKEQKNINIIADYAKSIKKKDKLLGLMCDATKREDVENCI
ncbi:MAG: hypothetical protein ACTSRG_04505 [Candidatus Helarchaeota archaeon]